LRHTLFSLPHSLDETYRRILGSIEEQEQAHVRRILQWLCFSARPLRLEEIAIIYQVADKIQPPFAHEDELFHPEDIIGICRGLLSLSFLDTDSKWRMFLDTNSKRRMFLDINSERRMWQPISSCNLQIVQLAHFSVKEYLSSSLSSPWTIDKDLSHVTIAKSAIAYYLHFMTLDGIRSLSSSHLALKYSLAQYLVIHVKHHLASAKEHPLLLPSLQLLMHPPVTPTANKLGGLLLDQSSEPGGLVDELTARDPATNVFLAIHYGLPQICRFIQEMSPYINFGKPPFLFIKAVAGTETRSSKLVQCGEKEVIDLLFDARAKPHYNVRSLDGGTFDLDAVDSGGRSPLWWAAERGNIDIIGRLVRANAAGIDKPDKDGQTPLSIAAKNGNIEVVKFLTTE
jgi:hypothetical protein